jgi:CTP:molybdopterin cytidylyltransferase MocA
MSARAAIVLAAGVGRRMGGPKALLVVDGAPLVRAHVELLRNVGCRPIVVVVRSGVATEVRAALHDLPEAHVISTDTSSMAESLAVGLGCISRKPSRKLVVTPVDALPVRESTLEVLLQAVTGADVLVATPEYHARGGHPIVARESLLQVFRDGYAGTLRDLIRAAERERHRIAIDDPAIAADLDTPADLSALRPGVVPCFASETPQRVTGITETGRKHA